MDPLDVSRSAVLAPSATDICGIPVAGYDFDAGIDFHNLMQSYKNFGFQATQLGNAIDVINSMLKARNESVTFESDLNYFEFPGKREKTGCTIFLGFTSNMISSGLRDIIRFIVKHNFIDCIVTSAGGVEEDFIKCLAPTLLGEFALKGSELRSRGINRIGNLLVPNENYCKFEQWILPLLDEMLKEQKEQGTVWTPSKMINFLGKAINDENSVMYWAWKNNVPVFCPALTDGSLGDMLYFHSYRNPGLVLDIIQDVRLMNNIPVRSHKTGMIILGGGIVKHHICNANLMRNGAEFAVFINTGQEFDGSDSGASPDEAISWGKIKPMAERVKVCCDATIAFPLIVADTFARKISKQ